MIVKIKDSGFLASEIAGISHKGIANVTVILKGVDRTGITNKGITFYHDFSGEKEASQAAKKAIADWERALKEKKIES